MLMHDGKLEYIPIFCGYEIDDILICHVIAYGGLADNWIFDEMIHKVRFYLQRVSMFPILLPLRIGIFNHAVTTPLQK